jgi:glycosyltransferase involved in cell wall biosynthesis
MRKAPKIAIVANTTWNIYNFRLGLMRELSAQGFRVVVIAPIDEYIHYLNDTHFIKHIALKKLNPQSKNPLKDLLLCKELYQIYKKEQPDLILHYTIKPNIWGNLAAKWANIPTISTLTGLGYTFLHGNFTKHIIRRLYKVALGQSKKLIFHNSDDQHLFKKYNLVGEGQGAVIPGSGVNTDFFSPIVKPSSKKFIFLFVGRLLYDKGIAEFVDAARQIRRVTNNTEYWVVGQLNAKNPTAVSEHQLQDWLENKDIRYFGTSNDIRKYLKDADVFVLPSYREGMPRAVLEAMASAKPIITTDTAGCRDTVKEEENGFLVPVKDSISLAKAMLKMYHLNREELVKMGEKSREMTLEFFDETIIISEYLKLIKQIISGNNEKQTKRKSQAIF